MAISWQKVKVPSVHVGSNGEEIVLDHFGYLYNDAGETVAWELFGVYSGMGEKKTDAVYHSDMEALRTVVV